MFSQGYIAVKFCSDGKVLSRVPEVLRRLATSKKATASQPSVVLSSKTLTARKGPGAVVHKRKGGTSTGCGKMSKKCSKLKARSTSDIEAGVGSTGIDFFTDHNAKIAKKCAAKREKRTQVGEKEKKNGGKKRRRSGIDELDDIFSGLV